MGCQIIRQPSGQFALFDSVTDTIIFWDATEDEIVEWFAEQAAASARGEARRKVDLVAAGNARAVYHQRVMTWEKALAEDRKRHGTASADAPR